MQLLYLAGVQLARKAGFRMEPPALLKPRLLWTGKQVITMLLRHLHPDARHLNMHSATKTAADMWHQKQTKKYMKNMENEKEHIQLQIQK